VTAGLAAADVVPALVTLEPTGRPRLVVDGLTFTVGLLGMHQAKNAMLVWAVGRELGLDPKAVARALESVTIPGGRGEVAQHGRLTILNDSYNANPASFLALIDTVATMRRGRRLVFVAGTMRELGEESGPWHASVAKALVDLEPEILAAVGEFGPALLPFAGRLGDRLVVASDAVSMGPLLAARLEGDELVVLKGSRGVALERMIPDLVARTAR
jgi:UDP-N-acetylmuramoyl-tripeptide--D-alanyl-D-alanine ligase